MDSFHKSVMMGSCHLSSASLVVKHPKLVCVCVCVSEGRFHLNISVCIIGASFSVCAYLNIYFINFYHFIYILFTYLSIVLSYP